MQKHRRLPLVFVSLLRNGDLIRSVFNHNLECLKSSHWVWDTAWPCPYRFVFQRLLGAWLAVPQTQRNNLINSYWIIKCSFLSDIIQMFHVSFYLSSIGFNFASIYDRPSIQFFHLFFQPTNILIKVWDFAVNRTNF